MNNNDIELRAALLRNFKYDRITGVFIRRSTGTVLRNPDRRGYLRIEYRKKTYYQHRMAYLFVNGCWPSEQVDHKNGQLSDNRWVNLRDADAAQNGANRKLGSNNFSGCKGVHFLKGIGKWRSDIQVQKYRFIIGNYVDWEEAVLARHMAELVCFGEFTRGLQ